MGIKVLKGKVDRNSSTAYYKVDYRIDSGSWVEVKTASDDLVVSDEGGNEGDLEMQVGGFVPPFGTQQQQGTGVFTQASQMGNHFNVQPQQFVSPSGQPFANPQVTGYGPSFGNQPQQNTIGFNQMIPMPMAKYENIRFVNKTTGEVMIIPHTDGKPVFPIPEGYVKEGATDTAPKDEKAKETVGETDTSVPTATVVANTFSLLVVVFLSLTLLLVFLIFFENVYLLGCSSKSVSIFVFSFLRNVPTTVLTYPLL